MIEPDDKEMHRYNTIVTVTTDDIDNAERVLSERLTYDEDYGFWYEIDYDAYDLQPEEDTRGIIIDASVIKDRLNQRMEAVRDDNPNDKRIINSYERIKSMDNGDLNALISSTDDDQTWELFDEMCDLILGFVVDETVDGDPS